MKAPPGTSLHTLPTGSCPPCRNPNCPATAPDDISPPPMHRANQHICSEGALADPLPVALTRLESFTDAMDAVHEVPTKFPQLIRTKPSRGCGHGVERPSL